MSAAREYLPAQRASVIAKLAGTLDEAVQLLHDAAYTAAEPSAGDLEQGTLLEQCLRLCEQQKATTAEPIRLVHHFSCTGGTLMCKCLGAMPNTQLLSEIDPLSTLGHDASVPSFAPTDLNRRLRQGTRSSDGAVLIELFRSEIRALHRHTETIGQYLVLRDHSHSHYCAPADPTVRPTLRACLPAELPVLAVITVRHPADSFVSMADNGWLYIQPPTFDEYCRRYLLLLDANPDVPIIRYEDFVADADRTMRLLCDVLELPFDADFPLLIGLMQLTGDSGRASNVIAPRPRRSAARELIEQSATLSSYLELTRRLGYDHPDDKASDST